MENDRTYFARRARAERRAAAKAGSDEARRRHLQLAELLAARLSSRSSSRSKIPDEPGYVNMEAPASTAGP